MINKLNWRIVPILGFLLLAVFLWRGLSLDPRQLPSAQIGKALPQFSIPQLQNSREIFNTQNLSSHVSLLNVWASWCESCAEEQTFLMQLARQGVPIYGLNYKDKEQDAQQWLDQLGNPFQLIGQDLDGKVAIDLGVYGAPETFVIDKHGIIRYRHVGVINETVWNNKLLPLIKMLEQAA